MKYEIAYLDGKIYLTFKSPEILRKLMGCVEDMAKSEIFNGHLEEARDLLDFWLDLDVASKEMEVEKNDAL